MPPVVACHLRQDVEACMSLSVSSLVIRHDCSQPDPASYLVQSAVEEKYRSVLDIEQFGIIALRCAFESGLCHLHG